MSTLITPHITARGGEILLLSQLIIHTLLLRHLTLIYLKCHHHALLTTMAAQALTITKPII